MQRHSGFAPMGQMDGTGICLRTRCRSSDTETGCHAPGCTAEALPGRSFCADCQSLLDRVRLELRPVARRDKSRL
jgi:hypothetical protein